MRFSILTALFGAAFMTITSQANANALSVMPTDAATICSLEPQEFDADWLKLTFPKARGNPLSGNTIGPFFDIKSGIVYIFPTNGPNFTEGAFGQPDECTFYKWGNQIFYWLTSSLQDGKMGDRPTNTSGPTADTKFVFGGEWFYHVIEGDNGLELATQGNTSKNAINPRASKGNKDGDGVGQAGRTNGVLFTQASTDVSNSSSTVYYSVHANRGYGYLRDAVMNSTFFKFDEFPGSKAEACKALYYGLLNGFIDIENKLAPLTLAMVDVYCPIGFIQDILEGAEGLAEEELKMLEAAFPILKEILKELAGSGKISIASLGAIENLIPYIEPAVDFLAMSTEVKISWVLSSTVANPENYIRTMGYVPTYSAPDSNGEMRQTGVKLENLSMVGMHVAGSVAGHSEMVWATIEHANNAPSAPYTYTDTAGKPKTWSDLRKLPSTSWLLSDGTANTTNDEHAIFHAKGSPIDKKDKSKGNYVANTIAPVKPGQTSATNQPSNVMRLNPWGSASTAASADTNSALISTNTSVFSTMAEFYKGTTVKDPRMNYVVTGTSWGKDGVFPTGNSVSQIDGTPAMANMTMETFTQEFGGAVNETGCFGCHGINPGSNKFDVSHIFNGINTIQK